MSRRAARRPGRVARWAFVTHAVSLADDVGCERLVVELDAQARPIAYQQRAVLDVERVLQHGVAPRHPDGAMNSWMRPLGIAAITWAAAMIPTGPLVLWGAMTTW